MTGDPVAAPTVDWSDFDQRMGYIAHLFRAYHLHDELLRTPFTAAQVELFARGDL
ncbi:MAG: hypothetical protein QOJ89_4983 [bacterium]|jgi:hypothetical protein